jgi:hypothetical protein
MTRLAAFMAQGDGMSSIEISAEDLPEVAPANHGRTLAAWVTNGGISVAALLVSVGVAIPVVWPIWVGIVVGVASLAAGGALRALGHGQPLK